MPKKNPYDLNKSKNSLAKHLELHHTTVNRILNSDLYKQQFGAESYYEKNSSANKEVYSIKLAIYKLMGMALPYFDDMKRLERKYDKHKSDPYKPPVNGKDILCYSRKILNSIPELEPIQQKALYNHATTKYNKVMDIYYDEFLARFSLIISLVITKDITKNPLMYRRILDILSEVLWIFKVEDNLGHTSENLKQYNINSAIKEVIKDFEEFDSEVMENSDYMPDLDRAKGKDKYAQVVEKLTKDYWKKVEKLSFGKYPDCEQYYKSLKYFNLLDYNIEYVYKPFFIAYASTSDKSIKFEILKQYLIATNDTYGRYLLPSMLDDIDSLTYYVRAIFTDVLHHRDINIKEKYKATCQRFIKITLDGEQYSVKFDPIKEFTAEVKEFISDIFPPKIFSLKDKLGAKYTKKLDRILKALCVFSKLIDNKSITDEEYSLIEPNIKYIAIYFYHCIGLTQLWHFKSRISSVNDDIMSMRDSYENDNDYYKMIHNEIDEAIGNYWAKDIFDPE